MGRRAGAVVHIGYCYSLQYWYWYWCLSGSSERRGNCLIEDELDGEENRPLTSDLGGPPPIFGPMIGEGPSGLGTDVGSEFGPFPIGGMLPEFLSMLRRENEKRKS